MPSPATAHVRRAASSGGTRWRRGSPCAPLHRPGRRARDVRCPLLVQVAADDAITPPAPAIEAAVGAPRGELMTYAGLGHFDVYRGEPFERAVADQLDSCHHLETTDLSS